MTLTHYAVRCGDRTIISCDTLDEAREQAKKWVGKLRMDVGIRRVTSEHVEAYRTDGSRYPETDDADATYPHMG